MTLAAWAGERRAVEVVSAGYFQAGSIWVASRPLMSDIGKEWWLSCSGNCAPHQVHVSTGLQLPLPQSGEPLAHAQSASQNRPAPV